MAKSRRARSSATAGGGSSKSSGRSSRLQGEVEAYLAESTEAPPAGGGGSRGGDSEFGFLASRADGTALPMVRGEHFANAMRAAEHPVMAMMPRHRAAFEALADGQRTLGEEEVRVLRHAARHPHLAGAVARSLSGIADLHDAARASDARRRG